MDFFYKIFPYKSLFEQDGGTLTAWWVVIIIVIFGFYVFRLFNVTRRLRKRLDSLLREFSEESINKDKHFSNVWKDYRESFFNVNGVEKTDENSYDYFNEKNLLNENTNLRLINSIPATLVGFGILGTFIGLTYGISNFKTTSTEQIKDSIEVLLSGMGTAFVSSIYGMLLSLVFTFFEKVQISSLHNSIHRLCYYLDKSFKISKEDERIIQVKRQESLLNDFFIFKDDNGNEVKPGNVLRDLYNESIKQSAALQSFSTDLANLIEAGFEKILNDPDKGVLYELQALKKEIKSLGAQLQDPATDMIEKMLEDLETSLGKMVNEFNESVSGSTKDELENLAKHLGAAGESLSEFPGHLEEMTKTLNGNFENLQVVVDQISQQILEQSEASSEVINEQVKQTTTLLTEKIGELQVGQEVLISKQTENLGLSSEMLGAFNTSIGSLNDLSIQIKDTVDSFNEVETKLNLASSRFGSISENVLNATSEFKEAQLKFGEHSTEFLERNKEILTQIQNSLTQARELSTEYSENFQVIEQGLSGIFEQIGSGLEEYKESVESSLENFLSEYTESLTETAKALSEAANTQQGIQTELLEELTEQLDKFKRNLR